MSDKSKCPQCDADVPRFSVSEDHDEDCPVRKTNVLKVSSTEALVLHPTHTFQNFQLARRPETPEDALHICQALYEAGIRFSVYGEEKIERMKDNPMIEPEGETR